MLRSEGCFLVPPLGGLAGPVVVSGAEVVIVIGFVWPTLWWCCSIIWVDLVVPFERRRGIDAAGTGAALPLVLAVGGAVVVVVEAPCLAPRVGLDSEALEGALRFSFSRGRGRGCAAVSKETVTSSGTVSASGATGSSLVFVRRRRRRGSGSGWIGSGAIEVWRVARRVVASGAADSTSSTPF